MSGGDGVLPAGAPRWLDEAPDALREAAGGAARTAERMDAVRAGLRAVLGESAVALGWSGEAATAAAELAADRCDQLGAFRDLIEKVGLELAATAGRFDDRRHELYRLAARELWEPADPIGGAWTAREKERVLAEVRAVDAAAAAHLALLADGLHGMANVRYAVEWIDPVAPAGSLVWLRSHGVLRSAAERDLVRLAAGLPPGSAGTARLRDSLYSLSAVDLGTLLEAHPAIAARLAADATVPRVLADAVKLPSGTARIAAVRAALRDLPEDERQSLALLYPLVLGSLDGAPVADRITANRVLISAALDAERAVRAGVLARLDRRAAHHGPIDYATDKASDLWDRLNNWVPVRSFVDDFEGDPLAQMERSDRRVAIYESLLEQRRQVFAFDPRGDGMLVELFGTLDAHTEHIAVLVPGTFMALEAYDGWAGIARDFQGQDPNLATVAWLGGDFPDTLTAAAHQSYAESSGPALRDFMAGLEIPPGASATVLGFSYGGAVVGVAEREGMVADRVLHVASAGAGAGVDSLDDYAGGVREHYTMTAPGDPIGLVQGVEVGPLGHGGDPDEMAGFVRLPTGCYGADDPRAGERVSGIAGHTGIFSRGSTAWDGMFAVMVGGLRPANAARCGP